MEAEAMVKRVIDGRAYNTETSELLARACDLQPNTGEQYDVRVYRTRGGAYFSTWVDFDSAHQGITPLSRERAKDILSGNDERYRGFKFTVIGNADELLADVPEAKGGDEPEPKDQESAIFFRVSKTFKSQIENAAKNASMSVNAWLLRCVEARLNPPSNYEQDALGSQIYSAMTFREQRARQYPDDNRNAASAIALKDLSAFIEGLPSSHPLFESLAVVGNSPDDTSDLEDFSSDLGMYLSRYGFDGPADHAQFVQDVRRMALEAALRQCTNQDE